jgi:hypothetical protein
MGQLFRATAAGIGRVRRSRHLAFRFPRHSGLLLQAICQCIMRDSIVFAIA